MKKALGMAHEPEVIRPIENPFGDFGTEHARRNENMILRTKKGDRSVEIELPAESQRLSDLIVPVSPDFREDTKNSAEYDLAYSDSKPGLSDREITGAFPQTSVSDESKRRDIETTLGLVPSADNSAPSSNKSYLASIDYVKQLYGKRRFEAALVECDQMIRQFPTDPKLYEMKGTLLDRLGYGELAQRSWNEALELNPSNETLKKFLQKRSANRTIGGGQP